MEKKDRLEAIIKHFNNGNKAQFSRRLGITPQTVSTWISRNSFNAELILAKCEGLNSEWLLKDQGEMLLSSAKDNTNNNISGGNNMTGNVNGGQMLNITMPESGTQKIIKPNGEIEIQRTDSTKSVNTREAELLKENSDLKERIAFLEGSMKGKDDLIANLQKTIELLCNRQ